MIDLEHIFDDQEPRIRASFIAMIANMKREVNMAELEALIENGQTHAALDLILRSAPNIATASGVAFLAAARETARLIGDEIGVLSIDYDITNQGAIDAMRNNNLRLVQGFTEGQRQATSEAVIEGIREGANPKEQARRFRDSIGLTASQQRAVDNYERALRGASTSALSNTLRNKSNDAAVAAAARSGEALSEARIARMVDEYRLRQIAHRATTIARTEALRSVHEGADAMYEQAFLDGTLDPDQVFQTWHTAKDERVRGSHAFMHKQVRPVGVPFTSGLGNLLRRPGDSSAPAADVINCRCRKTTQIRVRVIE